MRPIFFLRAFVLLCCAAGASWSVADDAVTDVQAGNPAHYIGARVCMACHQSHYKQMLSDKHGQATDSRTPFAAKGCESCHGPGSAHVNAGGGHGVGGLTVFGKDGSATEVQNAVCLGCHQGGQRMQWAGSEHDAQGLACASCHSAHQPHRALERQAQSEVCYACHRDIQAFSKRAFGHPLLDHKVVCSDCHNPHGSTTTMLLSQDSTNEVCYGCHAEKRGPFLWEHAPVVEDCTACHSPHGSMHPGDLVARPPQLCQRCHATSETGPEHTRSAYSFDNSGPGSDTSRFVLSGSCLNCHSQIHGSNHPSGVNLMR